MKKIGIYKGTFDPISQVQLEEALLWLREEHLYKVIFVIEKEKGVLSFQDRERLVKKAIAPFKKLSLSMPFIKGEYECIYKEASSLNEERIREGAFYLSARGTRKEFLKKEYYFEEIVAYHCKNNRYLHSLAVRDVCVELARANGLNENIARISGLLHDITKNKTDAWQEEMLSVYEPTILKMSPKVWHSETAVFFLKQELGLKDKKVLNAIWHHTLGTGKSSYAKILYIADKCEPTRGYDSSKELKLASENLEKGFELVMEESKRYREKENT